MRGQPERPAASLALAGLQARAEPHVLMVCTDRHHRLARLYPTPVGVLTEILVRGTTAAAVWLPDDVGLPAAPACRCHRPTALAFYGEPLNVAAAALADGPANVTKFRLGLRDTGRLPLLEWVDRRGVSRPVLMPTELGNPPVMEHLRRGGRISLGVQ